MKLIRDNSTTLEVGNIKMSHFSQLTARARGKVQGKGSVSGWALPKQPTSFAPEGVWTNIDLDVTPPERRIWTSLSVFGYWLSDIVSTPAPFSGRQNTPFSKAELTCR